MDRIEERRFHETRAMEDGDWDDVPMDVDGDDSEEDEDELRDIPEEFIEPICTGISDIVITGEVCARALIRLAIADNPCRRCLATAKHGIITISMAVFDHGMA